MRKVAALFVLLITVALVYVLNRNWVIGGNRVPPVGKFLDPFHGFWQNAEPLGYREPDELSIKGLKEPVQIIYDSLLIPHIFANNDHDLYLAQGYITARHRLWQMEFQVMAGMGRLSEIVGRAALDYDRRQRRIGMVTGARNALASIEKDTTSNRNVTAYTEGVNAYIQSLDYAHLPIEYKLLDYRPELWSKLKSAVVIMNFNQTLSFSNKDMEMTNALKLFGPEWVNKLYPDDEHVGDPIVSKPNAWSFKPVTLDTIALAVPPEMLPAQRPVPRQEPGIGSNNWAVSGSKTVTGSPMLCNDPHLDLNLPSLWFAVQLHAPGINCMGVSAPGGPGVIIGFNDSIAWGVTNAQRDLVDWYRIQLNKKNHTYQLDGEWLPVEWDVERFAIRDEPDFIDSIMVTQWGPIVSDASFHPENNRAFYALKWIAQQTPDEFAFLNRMDRARNYNDYLDAVDHHYSPAQNVAFASVKGDIAIKVQGQFPVRRPNEGKFILDGTKSSSGWHSFIPFDQNALLHNPPEGFVHSANQYPVDPSYPYYITADNYEAYRNRRIRQVLQPATSLTPEDMMHLQTDNYNIRASESLPEFIKYVDSIKLTSDEQNALTLLKSWDYHNEANSVAACYYETWWDSFYETTWDEMKNDSLELEMPTSYMTIRFMKEEPDMQFFDILSTPRKESAGDVVIYAFHEAVNAIKDWKSQHTDSLTWGHFKDTRIKHLARLEPFTRHVDVGGGAGIVNASERGHGPSWRQVVSLEPSGVKAWAVYPGGQSGNPGSPYYDNMIDHWGTYRYYRLAFGSADALKERTMETEQLKPSTP